MSSRYFVMRDVSSVPDWRSLRWVLFAALFAPLAAFVVLRNFTPDGDIVFQHTRTHFYVVGVTSLAAAAACATVIASARTLRETRLLFLALAFLTIAGFFSVHGLVTPGVIQHEVYASIGVSAWLSVLGGAFFVALSAVALPARAERMLRRGGRMIFAWILVGLATYIALSFAVDDWLDSVPTDDLMVQYAIAIAATMMFGFGAWRYAQAYSFARLPSQAAMVLALVLLMQVPAILLYGTVWYTSWWIYHALYASAFVVLFTGWAMEAKRAGSLSAIADALAMRDALAQLNRGRDARINELVEAIEHKDQYTVGHVHRVGEHAYEIGKRLGLAPADLRDVVLAAQMHDVGKIGVPDNILLKPERLTDDETAEMRKHAARGGDIASRVRALRAVASCVRHHHERYDGRGYPDGLAGDAIPIASRIIAVADTYDSMTSNRPYRSDLGHDAAVAEIQRVSGTQLDPRCVAAFLSIFEERGAAAAA
jgi:hypothetical protein